MESSVHLPRTRMFSQSTPLLARVKQPPMRILCDVTRSGGRPASSACFFNAREISSRVTYAPERKMKRGSDGVAAARRQGKYSKRARTGQKRSPVRGNTCKSTPEL
jgi:hypothetical protein